MLFKLKTFNRGVPQKKGGQNEAHLPFKGMKNLRGQAVPESLIALPLAGACFILCLWLFHSYTQTLWIDHQLYQSLICLSKGESKNRCKKRMNQKIKSFLWTGKLSHLKLYKKEEKWSGSFIWETRLWKIPFKKTLTKQDLL